MLNNPLILVATDFSEHSDYAVKAGEEVRKKSGGVLHLINISRKEDGLTFLQHEMDKQISRCEALCTHEIVTGKAYQVLNEYIEKMQPGMLIMGHKGRDLNHHFIGSLTSRMVASAKVPVMVVNNYLEVSKVTGLVDIEELEKKVFQVSEELSFLFNSDLEFLSVIPDISAQIARRSPIMSSEHESYSASERASLTKKAESKIRENLDSRVNAKVNVAIVESDKTAEEINKKLNLAKAGLVVMARH
ncbi:MAG: universal stress protein, partial [Bacteriovoracia bacterium]